MRKLIANNAIRMGLSLGLALLALSFAGADGEASLRAFLMLLGLRWLLGTPAMALEAAAVPALGGGAASFGRLQAAGGCALGLLCLIALAFDGFGAGWWVWPAATVFALVQLLSAPTMARLQLDGRQGAYTLCLIARRSADALAFVVILLLDAEMSLFFVVQPCIVIFAAALPLLYNDREETRLRAKTEPWALWGRSFAIALPQATCLRAPVLVLSALQESEMALWGALVFVLAGYARQASTIILVGLDGHAARLGLDRQRHLLTKVTVVQLALFATIGIVGAAFITLQDSGWSEWPEGFGMRFLALVFLGVLLRAIADSWTKSLSGLGLQRLLVAPALVSGVLMAAGLALSTTMGDLQGALLSVGASFALSQLVLVLALSWRLRGEAFIAPQSSQA